MNIPTICEVESRRAEIMTSKDKRQRWVTMDGRIHTEPVPYRDAISIRWLPIPQVVVCNYRPRLLAHSAT
jgi:hypothetical protein